MAALNYKEGFVRVAFVCCALYFLIAIPIWINFTLNAYQEVQTLKPQPTSQSDFFKRVSSVCRSYPTISCHKICTNVTDLEKRNFNRFLGASMGFAGEARAIDKHRYAAEDEQYYEQREGAWKSCLIQRYKVGYREMIATAAMSLVWIISAPVWLFLVVMVLIKLRHPMRAVLVRLYNTIARPIRWVIDGFKNT